MPTANHLKSADFIDILTSIPQFFAPAPENDHPIHLSVNTSRFRKACKSFFPF